MPAYAQLVTDAQSSCNGYFLQSTDKSLFIQAIEKAIARGLGKKNQAQTEFIKSRQS